jgi:hypothetical protein
MTNYAQARNLQICAYTHQLLNYNNFTSIRVKQNW